MKKAFAKFTACILAASMILSDGAISSYAYEITSSEENVIIADEANVNYESDGELEVTENLKVYEEPGNEADSSEEDVKEETAINTSVEETDTGAEEKEKELDEKLLKDAEKELSEAKANAFSEFTAGIFDVQLNDDGVTYSVKGYEGESSGTKSNPIVFSETTLKSSTSGVFPEQITYIAPSAFVNSSVQYIVIPESVTKIGNRAFKECSDLRNVIIEGNGLKEIGDEAFSGTGLGIGYLASDYFRIPSSVESIGAKAFFACQGLSGDCLDFDDLEKTAPVLKLGARAFEECTSITRVALPDRIESIPEYCFEKCSNLETIIINDTSLCTEIMEGAFENCTSIKVLPDISSILKIGKAAFANCTALYDVSAFNKDVVLEEIGDDAFKGAPLGYSEVKKRGEIVIPATVKKVGIKAFSGCTYLKKVTFKDGSNTEPLEFSVNGAGSSFVFADSVNLEEVILPERLTVLGANAFAGCKNLRRISNMGNTNLVEISDNAFKDCSALTSFVAPKTLVSVGESAFEGCTSLVNVSFDNALSLTTIGDYAFKGCDIGLYSTADDNEANPDLIINSPITYIGKEAFMDCKYIDKVVIGNRGANGVYINDKAFYGCSKISRVEIRSVSENAIGVSAFAGNTSLTRVVGYNGSSLEIGDAAFEGDTNLSSFVRTSSDGSSEAFSAFADEIDKTDDSILSYGIVTYVGTRSFSKCTNLRVSGIGSRVESIGNYGFAECAIGSIKATENEEENGARDLRITGNPVIGSYAFHKASCLKKLIVGKYKNTSISSDMNFTISGGDRAFAECPMLTDVNMGGSSVTNIPSYCFYKCEKLENLTVPATLNAVGDYAFAEDTLLKGFDATKVDGKSSNLESIGAYAFYKCAAMEVVTFGERLKTIGDYAFSEAGCGSKTNAGNKTLTFPCTLTSVGKFAFSKALRVTTVYFKDSADNITAADTISFGVSTFESCKSLTSINLPSRGTNVKLPNRFAIGCPVTSLYMPKNFTGVGDTILNNTGDTITVYGEKGSFAEEFVKKYKGYGFSKMKFDSDITKTDIKPQSISLTYLSSAEYEVEVGDVLRAGDVFNIGAKVFPETAENREITYESEDNEVVMVDKLGNVRIVGYGKTRVVAIAKGNTNIKNYCDIEVYDTFTDEELAKLKASILEENNFNNLIVNLISTTDDIELKDQYPYTVRWKKVYPIQPGVHASVNDSDSIDDAYTVVVSSERASTSEKKRDTDVQLFGEIVDGKFVAEAGKGMQACEIRDIRIYRKSALEAELADDTKINDTITLAVDDEDQYVTYARIVDRLGQVTDDELTEVPLSDLSSNLDSTTKSNKSGIVVDYSTSKLETIEAYKKNDQKKTDNFTVRVNKKSTGVYAYATVKLRKFDAKGNEIAVPYSATNKGDKWFQASRRFVVIDDYIVDHIDIYDLNSEYEDVTPVNDQVIFIPYEEVQAKGSVHTFLVNSYDLKGRLENPVLTWTSSDTGVARVTSKKLKDGTYLVTVTFNKGTSAFGAVTISAQAKKNGDAKAFVTYRVYNSDLAASNMAINMPRLAEENIKINVQKRNDDEANYQYTDVKLYSRMLVSYNQIYFGVNDDEDLTDLNGEAYDYLYTKSGKVYKPNKKFYVKNLDDNGTVRIGVVDRAKDVPTSATCYIRSFVTLGDEEYEYYIPLKVSTFKQFPTITFKMNPSDAIKLYEKEGEGTVRIKASGDIAELSMTTDVNANVPSLKADSLYYNNIYNEATGEFGYGKEFKHTFKVSGANSSNYTKTNNKVRFKVKFVEYKDTYVSNNIGLLTVATLNPIKTVVDNPKLVPYTAANSTSIRIIDTVTGYEYTRKGLLDKDKNFIESSYAYEITKNPTVNKCFKFETSGDNSKPDTVTVIDGAAKKTTITRVITSNNWWNGVKLTSTATIDIGTTGTIGFDHPTLCLNSNHDPIYKNNENDPAIATVSTKVYVTGYKSDQVNSDDKVINFSNLDEDHSKIEFKGTTTAAQQALDYKYITFTTNKDYVTNGEQLVLTAKADFSKFPTNKDTVYEYTMDATIAKPDTTETDKRKTLYVSGKIKLYIANMSSHPAGVTYKTGGVINLLDRENTYTKVMVGTSYYNLDVTNVELTGANSDLFKLVAFDKDDKSFYIQARKGTRIKSGRTYQLNTVVTFENGAKSSITKLPITPKQINPSLSVKAPNGNRLYLSAFENTDTSRANILRFKPTISNIRVPFDVENDVQIKETKDYIDSYTGYRIRRIELCNTDAKKNFVFANGQTYMEFTDENGNVVPTGLDDDGSYYYDIQILPTIGNRLKASGNDYKFEFKITYEDMASNVSSVNVSPVLKLWK